MGRLPLGPRRGAGSASARCDAHPWPRPRSVGPGAWLFPRRRPAPAFLKRLALLRGGWARLGRGGFVPRPADRLQHLPAPLGEDRGKPAFAGHPGRPLRTGPQPPIGRRRTKTRLELVQPLRLQNQRSRAVPAAQVAPSVQTLSLVARQPTLDPAPGLRHRGRNRGDGVPFGQKPDGLDGPRSRLCTSDTSLRALTRSDDPPPAPWLSSATQGASADRRPRSPEIPPDFFNRKPYNPIGASVASPERFRWAISG